MARTQAEIEADIARLEKARANPASEVQYGSDRVKMRTVAEIDSVLAQLRGELSVLTGTKGRPRAFRMSTTSGF